LRARILKNEFKLAYPKRLFIDNLMFSDDGTSGDQNSGDGIYTAEYIPVKEGTYHFNISATDSRDGKNIKRENQMEIYVKTRIRVKHFVKDVILTREIVANQKIYNVILNLNDKYGNVPTPSEMSNILLKIDNGELIGGITDNMDGTFTQKISLPESVKLASIKITLNTGVESGTQRLASNNSLLITIIGVIILVILGFLMRWKKK
jgi:hypothetical protein